MKNQLLITGISIGIFLSSCGEATQKTEENTTNQTTSEQVREGEHANHDHDALTENKILLCGSCGAIKGSDICCSADAEKCSKCGLIKGTPGCCKIQGDTELCKKCGEIKGSDNCCSADAVKCDKCDLNKGAPGCCKM